ncbi:hypothetical protein Enr13x_49690 [Stieleria neptunia]|uniref:Cytochrome C Planctomycete-type domain-containing protein n=1 Tax=Stieleria neptunia TaxID=2527979 RepID=A0A518HW69_9BACT|nr:hypothetical protein [Stieleria neptunia]QDV45096.1 hypothetical protein Enr13x_49690 [Stieleria neptunia]
MTFIRIAVALLMTGLSTQAIAEDLSPEKLQFFESEIRPVLVRECYGCHSNKAGRTHAS